MFSSKQKKLEVLIIDDSKRDRVLLINALDDNEQYEFDITEANSSKSGFDIISNKDYDFVFLDFIMDDIDGLSFLSDLPQDKKVRNKIFFTTSYGNSMIEEDCVAIGAKGYINKNEISKESISKIIH